MQVQFESSKRDFVRGEYRSSSDRHTLSEEELQEVLSYKDISEKFTYCNWYGAEYPITATIKEVKLNDRGYLIFTVETNKDIPSHYVPCPFQIMKDKNLLCPTTTMRH